MLWDGGAPRVALKKLTKGWYDGGIALPDIKLYYWASQLAVVNQWIYFPPTNPAFALDKCQTDVSGYMGALYTPPRKNRFFGPSRFGIRPRLDWDGQIPLRK